MLVCKIDLLSGSNDNIDDVLKILCSAFNDNRLYFLKKNFCNYSCIRIGVKEK